jgi:hypothetical protein
MWGKADRFAAGTPDLAPHRARPLATAGQRTPSRKASPMHELDTVRPELSSAPAGKQWRYWIGYYCPRGSGHFELAGNEDYDGCCGSKGWDLYLDADPEDTSLPEGEWRLVPLPS